MQRCAALLAGLFFASSSCGNWISDRFIDPEDGQFDVSAYLLDHRGALPVPIFITEPAVGYGGGIALAWFSESLRDVATRAQRSGQRPTPPDIFGVAAVGTENGTKGIAAGARMSFLNDTLRYRGMLGVPSINLDFYGIGDSLARAPVPAPDKIGYNLEGYLTFHELAHRLGNTDHFLGVRLLYLDMETQLDFGTPADAGLEPRELARKGAAIGLTYVFDSRDNIFTTRSGVHASIDAMFYSPSIGSDTKFQAYRGHAFAYIPAHEKVTVAVRVDGRAAHGDVPFYQAPYIDLRGVPAARYQDENVGAVEIEGRYYVTPRWIALAFLGAGRAWGRSTSFEDERTIVTKGVGFRYMIARRLGLSMGIDIARGPEETAFYLQVGNAWR